VSNNFAAKDLEARLGFQPRYKGFADLYLTTLFLSLILTPRSPDAVCANCAQVRTNFWSRRSALGLSDSRSLLQELGSCWTASKAAIHEIAKKKSQMSDPLPISVASFGCGVFVWNPRERRSLQDGSGMLAKDPPSALLHFVVGPGHLPFFKASKEFLDAVWRFLSGERKEMHCGC